MSELEELPGLDRWAKLLGKLDGFGFILCATPSRAAAEDAEARIVKVAKDQGRAVIGLHADGQPGAVTVERTNERTPAQRKLRFDRLNLQRDRLGNSQRVLMLILLEQDLADFAATAPDLWSVRTELLRHARLPMFHAGKPRDLGAGVPAAEIDAATRFVSLQGLQVGADGRRIPQAELDHLYIKLFAASPAGQERSEAAPQENADQLLTRFETSILLAPAGSGKSTLLRHLARSLVPEHPPVLVTLAGLDCDGLDPRDLDAGLLRLIEACPWRVESGVRPWLLLDGLDEVGDPERRRALVLLANDLVREEMARGAVLSARPEVLRVPLREGGADLNASSSAEDILADIPRVSLLELGDKAVRAYLDRWVTATLPQEQREAHLAILVRAVGLDGGRTGRIRQLCRRPLFLAVVAALVWARGEEIRGEAELLDSFVRALVHRRRAGTWGEYGPDDLVDLARETAWVLDQRGSYAAPTAEVCRNNALLDDSALEALRIGTGLLVDDPKMVRFVHAALQDVLVARAVFARVADDKLADWLWGARAPVKRLLAEIMASQAPNRLRDLFKQRLGSPDEHTGYSRTLRALNVAQLVAEVWAERAPLLLRREVLPDLSQTLLQLAGRDRSLPRGLWPELREQAVLLLGLLGDRRIGDTEFLAIDDKWEIGRWPVTNRVFRPFVENGGYQDQSLWTKEGWVWRKRRAARSKDAPERWEDPAFRSPNQPVCGLSHHEARAFVNWVKREQDRQVELPSRELWVRVVKGMNIDQPHPPHHRRSWPAPVGARREHATRDGIEDLGSLIREWLSDQGEVYGGYAFCDEPRPLVQPGSKTGGGRRWYHPFGLRLARHRT